MKQRYAPKSTEPVDELEDKIDNMPLNFDPISKPGIDAPIYPGGPLRSLVDSWKKQYGEVYITEIGEDAYVWRPLNRFEYKTIVALRNTDPLQREELICEQCVLFPVDYDISSMANGKAGVPALLAENIMEASGFTRSSAPQML